jgi:hypothetical protein
LESDCRKPPSAIHAPIAAISKYQLTRPGYRWAGKGSLNRKSGFTPELRATPFRSGRSNQRNGLLGGPALQRLRHEIERKVLGLSKPNA